jgi:hypothetical protein
LPDAAAEPRAVLFYTRGKQEKPDQLIREPGPYRYTLRLEEAVGDQAGMLDWLWPRRANMLTFER